MKSLLPQAYRGEKEQLFLVQKNYLLKQAKGWKMENNTFFCVFYI